MHEYIAAPPSLGGDANITVVEGTFVTMVCNPKDDSTKSSISWLVVGA
jgi:hypothetical protein